MASGSAGPEPSPTTVASPVPLPNSSLGQAPSVISSQLTDLGSENEDAYAEGAVPSIRPETAFSGGTFSNDLNRPGSAVSSQPRSWTNSQNSRRGIASPRAFGGWRLNGAFGGPGTMMSNSSRPESNTSSRTSRTHIPSLASHAFFRPMSSQRLQAQRGTKKPAVRGQSIASIDGASDLGSATNRNSIGSNITAQPGPDASQPRDSRPQSIGIDFKERENLPTVDDSLAGNATNQSMGGSERPQSSMVGALPSIPEKNDQHRNGTAPPIRRSPRSFRPSFLLPSRYSDQARNNRFSHERLSSSNSSPPSMNSKTVSEAMRKPGFNYQYFTGNTVFCWGGRLQNTRDRPINVISGMLILLPSVLFLACSGPYLSRHVSPVIPVFYAYLFFLCLSSFIHASVTDPGILPRNLHLQIAPHNSEDPLTLGPPTTDWSDRDISFAQSIRAQRVPFAMFLYGLLASPYPACLWVYHLYLMGRGETTREYLNSHKFLKKDRHRPFSQGSFLRNWLVILLRPRPPTYLDFSKEYEEGDRRFGERRGKRAVPLVVEQPDGGSMEMQGVRGMKTPFQGPALLRAS
ncbi:MAG: hypothetical protein Q9193_000968 [Seirophora villosa]